MIFGKEGRELSYFSMVTTVGTPHDVTLQELRVESFFPAAERARRFSELVELTTALRIIAPLHRAG